MNFRDSWLALWYMYCRANDIASRRLYNGNWTVGELSHRNIARSGERRSAAPSWCGRAALGALIGPYIQYYIHCGAAEARARDTREPVYTVFPVCRRKVISHSRSFSGSVFSEFVARAIAGYCMHSRIRRLCRAVHREISLWMKCWVLYSPARELLKQRGSAEEDGFTTENNEFFLVLF